MHVDAEIARGGFCLMDKVPMVVRAECRSMKSVTLRVCVPDVHRRLI